MEHSIQTEIGCLVSYLNREETLRHGIIVGEQFAGEVPIVTTPTTRVEEGISFPVVTKIPASSIVTTYKYHLKDGWTLCKIGHTCIEKEEQNNG